MAKSQRPASKRSGLENRLHLYFAILLGLGAMAIFVTFLAGWITNLSEFTTLVVSGLVVAMYVATGALAYRFITSRGQISAIETKPPSSEQEVVTLKRALADELTEVANRMRPLPPPADLPNALTFDYATIDLPVYSSLVNSGKIFLLEDKLVRALNELNQNIQDMNRANEDLRRGLSSLTPIEARLHLGEFNRIMLNPDAPTEDPLVGSLKVSLLKKRIITSKILAIQTDWLGAKVP
jgi:hypothetical protein